MTAIGNTLGVQLPPCGSSNDEDVEVPAPQDRSGGARRSRSRGSRRAPAFVTSLGVSSAAQQEGTEEILAAIDAHVGSEGTEIIGSDHSERRIATPVLFPSDEDGLDD